MFHENLLLVIVFAIICVNGNEPIPADLLRQLKSASSIHDIMSITTILHKSSSTPTQTSSPSRYRNFGYSDNHRRIKIQGASFIALPNTRYDGSSQSEAGIDDEMQANLAILSTIRQGNDTCTLQNICVPVPVDNPDPSVLVFPRCYEISQCVGSCCDSIESCHATAVEYLQKPVVEMVYAGHNRFMINQTVNIRMEQHLACSCRDCSTESQSECRPGYVIGASCTCECANQMQKQNCKGGSKRWNEDSCTCECPIHYCPGGGVLNEEKCACEEPLIELNEPDDAGNFRTDISKLPRLRSSRLPRLRSYMRP